MDWTKAVVVAATFLSRMKPKSQGMPEFPDISKIYAESMGNMEGALPHMSATATIGTAPPVEVVEGEIVQPDVSVACIACSRAHVATVAGALGEAIRFAREGGMTHPEVVRRCSLAENEIGIMERVDLSPSAIAAAPPEEKEIIDDLLPRIRSLRQHVVGMASVDDLINTAGEAEQLGVYLRMKVLQSKGVDVAKVSELTAKVKSGEMTLDEAKNEIRSLTSGQGRDTP